MARFVLTVILVLTVFVALSQPGDNGTPGNETAGTYESSGTCQEVRAVMVYNSTDGIQVTVSSSVPQSTPVQPDITIAGEHLPTECGPNKKRCNIVPIPFGTHLFTLFSVRKGIAIVEYNQTTLEYVNYFVFKTSLDCTPTAIFFSGPNKGYQLFTACVNFSNDNSYLQYIAFSFNSSDITTASFRYPPLSHREKIYDPDTLSEFVYARNQDCFSADNVYVLDEGYMIRFLADIGQRRFVDPIEVCPEPRHLSVEYYGDNLLLVRCSNNTALTFDSCRGFVTARYQLSESGLPYPCSDWDTVAVVKDGNLTFNTSENSEVDNTTTLTLPTGAIENAQCVGGNQDTIFVFTVNRKTTYAFSAPDNLLLEIVPLSCNATECFKPIVLSTEGASIIGAYDYKSSSFMVANPTCTSNPVILDLPVVRPDLAALFFGRTRHSCQCKPVTEPPSTSPTTAETETEQTSPTTVPSTEMSTTTDEATSNPAPTTPVIDNPDFGIDNFGAGPLAATITLPVAVFVAVVIAVAVFLHRKIPKRRQNSRTNILGSLPSSVRESLELWPISLRYGPVHHEPDQDPPMPPEETDQRTVSVQIEPPQEPGFYGDLDIREVAPVVDSNRGDFDVAGVLNAPMPPDRYHLVSLLEAEQHRCSTDEKRNDLQQKMNAF